MKRLAGVATLLIGCGPALAWHSISDIDPITGKGQVGTAEVAGTTSIRPHRQAQRSGPPAKLLIFCRDGRLHVAYRIENTLVAGRQFDVDYRFDDAKPVHSTAWQGVVDRTAAVLPSTAAAVAFLNTAAKHKTLAFRTSDDVFGQTEAYFDLTGLAHEVQPALKACRITNGPKAG